MRVAITAAIVLMLAAAAPATAQVYDPLRPYTWPGATAETHRLEMDRLRARAQANAIELRLNNLETRLTIQQLQARRQPPIYVEPPPRLLGSPEAERARREGATQRREGVQSGVGQIDDWLDRGPE